MPIVLKSGSLKLLEPSTPVQACNEIALPFSNGIADSAEWQLVTITLSGGFTRLIHVSGFFLRALIVNQLTHRRIIRQWSIADCKGCANKLWRSALRLEAYSGV